MSDALDGRHILVTGGGSGIGLACAARLRADGAVVTLMGRTAQKLETAAGTLRQQPGPEELRSRSMFAHAGRSQDQIHR